MQKRNFFAAIPERAIGDRRLTATHFRVLGAVALHDRLSHRRKSGAGCYASNKTLSQACGVNYNNFSTAVKELGEWGYLVAAPHPINKRTRVYRVRYDTSPTGELSEDDDTSPRGEATAQIPRPEANDQKGTLRPPDEQAADSVGLSNDKYIPLNGKRFSETEIDSAEAAHSLRERDVSRQAERLNFRIGKEGLRNDATRKDGAFLAIVERELRSGSMMLDSITELEVEAIMDRYGSTEPLFCQAERILVEYGTGALS